MFSTEVFVALGGLITVIVSALTTLGLTAESRRKTKELEQKLEHTREVNSVKVSSLKSEVETNSKAQDIAYTKTLIENYMALIVEPLKQNNSDLEHKVDALAEKLEAVEMQSASYEMTIREHLVYIQDLWVALSHHLPIDVLEQLPTPPLSLQKDFQIILKRRKNNEQDR